MTEIKKAVREGYAKVAKGNSSCCGSDKSCCGKDEKGISEKIGYSKDDINALSKGFPAHLFHPDDISTVRDSMERFRQIGDEEVLENEVGGALHHVSAGGSHIHILAAARIGVGCRSHVGTVGGHGEGADFLVFKFAAPFHAHFGDGGGQLGQFRVCFQVAGALAHQLSQAGLEFALIQEVSDGGKGGLNPSQNGPVGAV